MSVTTLGVLTSKAVDRSKKIDRLSKKKEAIEKQIKELHSVHYKDEVFVPLAEALLPYTKRKSFQIMGPFGLGCHISIVFHDRKDWVKDKRSKTITFSPTGLYEDGTIRVVNESEDTGRFAKDTIGYINGMNHPTDEIDSGMSIKEIADKYINKRRRTKK